MTNTPTPGPSLVSIVIPVFNKLAFTRQCLQRLDRHAGDGPSFEVIIVDNASTDGTREWFERHQDRAEPSGERVEGGRAGVEDGLALSYPLVYIRNDVNEGFSRANNIGAARSAAKYLLFLNNDTLPTAGWLQAMVDAAEADARVGIVGIKQLFPYTNRIHHTGIIITADGRPQHIYPHSDASLPHVNRQREYQAVTGSCLLIPRDLFDAAGDFDEGYRNGYEDIDLCLTVRKLGRTVLCCTSGFIYHYGQISETRTADDDRNAARLASRWGATLRSDEHEYFRKDRADIERQPGPARRSEPNRNLIYFADDLSAPSALTWVTSEVAFALHRLGADVALRQCALPSSVPADRRRALTPLMRAVPPVGGIQIRWSHYWPQHLNLDLDGRLNLELFVINYLFARPNEAPWDYWLQSLTQNRYLKLPLSDFNRDVLAQIGVPASDCAVFRPGYSPEIAHVAAPRRRDQRRRLLTVTNSHDLERYGTKLLLDAYWATFSRKDDVTLVVKDYGTSSGDTTLRDLFRAHGGDAAVEYVTEFTSKEKLIELYKSCDGFVSAHRGEGYGMKILDALACGLPVVTPLFGGPTDFCTPENCLPVDFSLVPMGDCLDSRSLHITNGPTWAEADPASLGAAMRRLVESPELARQLGARAEADVRDRLTWDAAARSLLAFAEARSAVTDAPSATPAPAPAREPAERSPYWMGCRVSVIIPTFNRSAMLAKCLHALERQTILPQEFEVVIVDDGSTDDTAAVVAGLTLPFHVKYVRQDNAGPGRARNEGLRHATGEFVLFIGDDILAEPRLLETHLLAHVEHRDPGTAILGHIDWPADMPRSAVMDFVCGPSTLQFAYTFIPTLPELDFRFFYTSNISLRRQFLLDAAADGVTFDPDFTAAAFEDSEFALRLERRGLRIVYAADALAYHEHWMDLDSFARRERGTGRMAVVFYRKHPRIDEQLQVRWIADWAQAVEDLLAQPALEARLRALDEQTDGFLRSLAGALEEMSGLQRQLGTNVLSPGGSRSRLLDAVLTVLFDIERTRGKVEEWYANVQDPRKAELAAVLLGCVRRLEFLSSSPEEVRRLRGTITWLETDVVGHLEHRVSALERHLQTPLPGGQVNGSRPAQLHGRLTQIEQQLAVTSGRGRSMVAVTRFLRRADLSIQYRLGRYARGFLLPQYRAMRGRLRRWLPGPPAR